MFLLFYHSESLLPVLLCLQLLYFLLTPLFAKLLLLIFPKLSVLCEMFHEIYSYPPLPSESLLFDLLYQHLLHITQVPNFSSILKNLLSSYCGNDTFSVKCLLIFYGLTPPPFIITPHHPSLTKVIAF